MQTLLVGRREPFSWSSRTVGGLSSRSFSSPLNPMGFLDKILKSLKTTEKPVEMVFMQGSANHMFANTELPRDPHGAKPDEGLALGLAGSLTLCAEGPR